MGAIPQGLNRPGTYAGTTAEKNPEKISKIVLKHKNTRTCDKSSPVSQIEQKSHCFEAGVLYSSQRCGDVIGAVS